jgi:hypothetical protein
MSPQQFKDASSSVAAQSPQNGSLTAEELAQFEQLGWLGRYPLLTASECSYLYDAYKRTHDLFSAPRLSEQKDNPHAFVDRPWCKSMHAYVPEYFELVSHPAIVERVSSILGPDIVAWGASVMVKVPQEIHRWHVDIEHWTWPGVSVFIGLDNVSTKTSLKLISRSHHLQARPQEFELGDDSAALSFAKELDPDCQLVTSQMQNGDFIIFHGKMWHGSCNDSDKNRAAIILQYSAPSTKIAIPLNFNDPVCWHSHRPPCVLVKGRDHFGLNHLIPHPISAGETF